MPPAMREHLRLIMVWLRVLSLYSPQHARGSSSARSCGIALALLLLAKVSRPGARRRQAAGCVRRLDLHGRRPHPAACGVLDRACGRRTPAAGGAGIALWRRIGGFLRGEVL